MSILVKGMAMPKECHGCRWFCFNGTSCTEPRYFLDARCELVESGQDWYGKDSRGGWVGESIEHLPGWGGRYPHMHCVADGTRAKQCPLAEIKTPHGDLIDRDELFIPALSSSHDNEMVGDIISDAPVVIEAEGRT